MSTSDAIQLILTLLTTFSLALTVYFNVQSLKASRQQSVAQAFLSMNQRVQEILYEILESDNEALKKLDMARPQKFRFYQLIDSFADMHQMLPMLREHDPRLATLSVKRMQRVACKPAVQATWKMQYAKNPEIFSQDFARFMEEAGAAYAPSGAAGHAVSS